MKMLPLLPFLLLFISCEITVTTREEPVLEKVEELAISLPAQPLEIFTGDVQENISINLQGPVTPNTTITGYLDSDCATPVTAPTVHNNALAFTGIPTNTSTDLYVKVEDGGQEKIACAKAGVINQSTLPPDALTGTDALFLSLDISSSTTFLPNTGLVDLSINPNYSLTPQEITSISFVDESGNSVGLIGVDREILGAQSVFLDLSHIPESINHNLTIRVTDIYGNTSADSLVFAVVNRTSPLSLSITNEMPASGYLDVSQDLAVSGNRSFSGVVTGDVSGAPLSISDGSVISLEADTDSANSKEIQIAASDIYGNEATFSYEFFMADLEVNLSPGTLAFNGGFINDNEINIEGSTNTPHQRIRVLRGATTLVDSSVESKNFSHVVSLSEGLNELTILVTDLFGGVDSIDFSVSSPIVTKKVRFTYWAPDVHLTTDTTPPALTLPPSATFTHGPLPTMPTFTPTLNFETGYLPVVEDIAPLIPGVASTVQDDRVDIGDTLVFFDEDKMSSSENILVSDLVSSIDEFLGMPGLLAAPYFYPTEILRVERVTSDFQDIQSSFAFAQNGTIIEFRDKLYFSGTNQSGIKKLLTIDKSDNINQFSQIRSSSFNDTIYTIYAEGSKMYLSALLGGTSFTGGIVVKDFDGGNSYRIATPSDVSGAGNSLTSVEKVGSRIYVKLRAYGNLSATFAEKLGYIDTTDDSMKIITDLNSSGDTISPYHVHGDDFYFLGSLEGETSTTSRKSLFRVGLDDTIEMITDSFSLPSGFLKKGKRLYFDDGSFYFAGDFDTYSSNNNLSILKFTPPSTIKEVARTTVANPVLTTSLFFADAGDDGVYTVMRNTSGFTKLFKITEGLGGSLIQKTNITVSSLEDLPVAGRMVGETLFFRASPVGTSSVTNLYMLRDGQVQKVSSTSGDLVSGDDVSILFAFNDSLFFRANGPDGFKKLYSVNESGEINIVMGVDGGDVFVCGNSQDVSNDGCEGETYLFDNKLYFRANVNNAGYELFRMSLSN